jgi:hypothetical protein
MNCNSALLLEELTALERQLFRRDRNLLEALLHPEFVEFGRSGRRYSRADILNDFGGPISELPAIDSRSFDVVVLAEGVALLTYVSAPLDANGTLYRYTLRSSVWVRSKVGWQMRFHQGTPTTPVTLGLP